MSTGKLSRAVDGFHALDELSGMDTSIHRLHPISKALVTLLFVAAVVSSPRLDIAELCPYFLYPLLFAALAEVPVRQVFRRTFPALPFVLFAGISNILFDSAPHLYLGRIAVSRGVVSCLVLVEKTLLSVSAVVLLSATTPSVSLLAGMQRMGMPKILITTCMLCFRYLSLLMDEAGNMMRAYHLRSGRQKGIDMRDMGSFAGQLLLRSFDKAGRIYSAMQCRGFTGNYLVAQTVPVHAPDIIYPLLMAVILAFFRFFGFTRLFAALFGGI
ncbi:MAG: cobalt ECF transporter T component CbiQ [Clostridia bacterium]